MTTEEKQLIINYYNSNGLDLEDFPDLTHWDYMEENYNTLKECKEANICTYDAERIIDLRSVLGCDLTINQAMQIITTLEVDYSLDSFDLEGVLRR